MEPNSRRSPSCQAGFTLVEIMVGMAIGLLATLVIVQVMSVFEAQKRTTTGTADAQTNGGIALYTIGRDLQMAGFGLTAFDANNSPLRCTTGTDISPVTITDGGDDGDSDVITVRYGATQMGGVPIRINGVTITATPAGTAGVDNNLGCQAGNSVLIVDGANCVMTNVADPMTDPTVPPASPDTTHIKLTSAAGVATGANLACLGTWNTIAYAVNSGNLRRAGADSVAGIVNIQAQYGISATATDNQVAQWVNASAAPLAFGDRNRIKAIRVAVVARNAKMEPGNVTASCNSLTATEPTGLCAWAGSNDSPAPAINLSNDPDGTSWMRYRYRVFETIIPLRNVIWAKGTL